MRLQWLASQECNNFWLFRLRRVIGDCCMSVACYHVMLVILWFPLSWWCVCVCVCVCMCVFGGWLAGCFQSREFLARFSLSEVYPPGKLQWHFTYVFRFGHGLWLPFVTAFVVKGLLIVPVGNMGHFEPGNNTFQTFFLRKQREHAPRLPSFMLNHFHNILRLFHALPNFPLTTGETMRDYYL